MKKNLLTQIACGSLLLTGASGAFGAGQPLLSISKTSQNIDITGHGLPARIYKVQSSPTVPAQAWKDRTTVITDAKGLFNWMDSLPKDQPMGFYRLVQYGVLGGVVVKHQVSLTGGAYIDSYNPNDPAKSTGGLYDPAKRSDSAIVITDSSATGAIYVGASHIYGQASTGQGGTVVCGTGAIGDLAWNANNTGIEPGHVTDDASIVFQDISAPFASAPAPAAGAFNGVNYTYVLGNGNFQLSTLNMGGQANMAVTGNAVLYVTGDFVTSGQSYIYVAPGASLQIFVGGNFNLAGMGIINSNQRASSCSIFGLPGCTSMILAGTSAFYGIVDAPEAVVNFSGTAGACGSFMADSLLVSGTAGLHYDESLSGITF